MPYVSLLAGLTVGLAGVGLIEERLHRRRLAGIPIRVHVNGTRGKSSVTRLIAAALRQAGRRVLAKTTGTLPRIILPTARELPIYRPARANVLEQIRVVATAAEHGVDALVVECMALQPHLQWLTEGKLIRATHGVITNVRPDHLDVMGPDERDVALALAATVPVGGKLFTGVSRHLDVFDAAARDRGTSVTHVTEAAAQAVGAEVLARFRYREHAENVALALSVCADLGVDRDTALQGMWSARPDAGALTEYMVDFFGRRVVFVNGFAANDPESSERIWRDAIARHPNSQVRIALYNCRSDRPDRSVQLAEASVTWPAADWLVLMGTGTYVFAKAAVARGAEPPRLVFAEGEHPGDIFEQILSLVPETALVVGLGNIGGPGLPFLAYISNRARRL